MGKETGGIEGGAKGWEKRMMVVSHTVSTAARGRTRPDQRERGAGCSDSVCWWAIAYRRAPLINVFPLRLSPSLPPSETTVQFFVWLAQYSSELGSLSFHLFPPFLRPFSVTPPPPPSLPFLFSVSKPINDVFSAP